jgi:hypothetical protein
VDSVGPRPVETPAHRYKFPGRIPLRSLTSGAVTYDMVACGGGFRVGCSTSRGKDE